jgi:type IX secretion system PorP/SprF family membrane protein
VGRNLQIMKKAGLLFSMSLALALSAQQVPQYIQHGFNRAGLNPAAAGLDNTQKINYVFGTSRLWGTFENSPRSSFINFSYTIRPPRGYRYWQNAGIYFEDVSAGLMGSNGIYGTYTFHLLVQKKNVLSFGIMGGARLYERSVGYFDVQDPAVARSQSALWVYPDLIPGVRFTTRKFYFGCSARQVTITRLKNWKNRSIGGPSRLQPHLYLECGKSVEVGEQILMVPSLALSLPLLAPPTVDGSLLFYFAHRLGLGAAVRNSNFVSGIIQIRFLQTMTAGFSYSYPMNQTRYVAGNSFEIMLGIAPSGMNQKLNGISSVARCPTLAY